VAGGGFFAVSARTSAHAWAARRPLGDGGAGAGAGGGDGGACATVAGAPQATSASRRVVGRQAAANETVDRKRPPRPVTVTGQAGSRWFAAIT
jgi:hypothetical protein